MSAIKNTIVNFPISILVAILVTAILFMGLPLLTKFQRSYTQKQKTHSVLISARKPPKPPDPERDKKVERKEVKKEVQKTRTITRTATPRIDLPAGGLGASLGGTISIGGLNTEFNISDSLFLTAFQLNEVDQPPRPQRTIPPRYPFQAQQKGIEGKVTLRFVVDKDGNPQEPQVVKVEPEEVAGVFDDSALETVRKYKFKPAIKDGAPVDCIVRLPIVFTLSQ